MVQSDIPQAEADCDHLRAEVPALKTDPKLLALLERARSHVMTPAESYAQRRSFVRGMCPSNRDYRDWCDTVDRLLPQDGEGLG